MFFDGCGDVAREVLIHDGGRILRQKSDSLCEGATGDRQGGQHGDGNVAGFNDDFATGADSGHEGLDVSGKFRFRDVESCHLKIITRFGVELQKKVRG